MNTVKEFKEKGLVFVDGDEGSGYRIADAESFNRRNIWDKCTPTEFAWRPLNTLPESPKFKYEVNTEMHQWRPLLDVEVTEDDEAFNAMEETKPVFTQEMADAGELPLFGVRVVGVANGLELEGYLTEDGFLVGAGNAVQAYTMNDAYELTFKPIKTERQKAVDNAFKAIRVSEDDVMRGIIYECVERLYDAGLLKGAE